MKEKGEQLTEERKWKKNDHDDEGGGGSCVRGNSVLLKSLLWPCIILDVLQ